MDEGVQEGDWVVVASPVNLTDGRRLMWWPPQPVAFNLLEARRHRDRGVRQRKQIMGNLQARPGGAVQPANAHAALDCLSELAAAVLFGFTAVESLANHAIESLAEDAVVEIRTGRQLPKARLVLELGIEEKLKRVVPLADGGRAVAGTAAWERFRELKFLRDELLHVKERGYDPDPDVRTAYDRLIVGEGDGCVEGALSVIQGAYPDFLPNYVLDELRGESSARAARTRST